MVYGALVCVSALLMIGLVACGESTPNMMRTEDELMVVLPVLSIETNLPVINTGQAADITLTLTKAPTSSVTVTVALARIAVTKTVTFSAGSAGSPTETATFTTSLPADGTADIQSPGLYAVTLSIADSSERALIDPAELPTATLTVDDNTVPLVTITRTPEGNLTFGQNLAVTATVTRGTLGNAETISIDVDGGGSVPAQPIMLAATASATGNVNFASLAVRDGYQPEATATPPLSSTSPRFIIAFDPSASFNVVLPVVNISTTPSDLSDLIPDEDGSDDLVVTATVGSPGPLVPETVITFTLTRMGGSPVMMMVTLPANSATDATVDSMEFADLAAGEYELTATAVPDTVTIVGVPLSFEIAVPTPCLDADNSAALAGATTSTGDCDGDGDMDDVDVDDDNDGLIEIRSLTDLNNVRNDLDGNQRDTSVDTANPAQEDGSVLGAPMAKAGTACESRTAADTLCGYELVSSLTFTSADDLTLTPPETFFRLRRRRVVTLISLSFLTASLRATATRLPT